MKFLFLTMINLRYVGVGGLISSDVFAKLRGAVIWVNAKSSRTANPKKGEFDAFFWLKNVE